jgi:MSHA pilin protein MshA
MSYIGEEMNSNKQQGFTLIELVMVIVILGILAATALPKLVGLGGQARTASVKALTGAVQSAESLAVSTYLAGGILTATTITTSDGTSVAVAAGTGIPTAAGIQAMVVPSADYAATTPTGTVVWTFSNATTPASCIVTYTVATGVATATTTGC